MTCEYCELALRDPEHGMFTTRCQSCRARLIANGPESFQLTRYKNPEPLKRRILSAFGPSEFDKHKAEVWKWVKVFHRYRNKIP